jgi:hypothetical protein
MSVTTYKLLDLVKVIGFRVGDFKADVPTLENPDPAILNMVHCVNEVIRKIAQVKGLPMMNGRAMISTVSHHQTGYVVMTKASTTVSKVGLIDTVFTNDMEGRAFAVLDKNAIFRIESVIDDDTLVLDSPWPFDTANVVSYTIAQDRYALPADFSDFISVSMEGTSGRSLAIVAPAKIDYQRHSMRSSVMSLGTPSIVSKFDKSASGAWEIELDPFPDNEYILSLRYKRAPVKYEHDNDIVPVPDEAIDVLINGVVALWKSIKTPELANAYLNWQGTDLAMFATLDQKGTDQGPQIVPANVMRGGMSRSGGSDPYPLSFSS